MRLLPKEKILFRCLELRPSARPGKCDVVYTYIGADSPNMLTLAVIHLLVGTMKRDRGLTSPRLRHPPLLQTLTVEDLLLLMPMQLNHLNVPIS
jgi:hypothetical protein